MPYYTCKAGNLAAESTDIPVLKANSGAVFNSSVFDYEKKYVDSMPVGDYTGMYANFESDGIKLYVDVTDSSIMMNATSVDEILNYDSLIIAFDAYGNGRLNERNEFHVGMVNGSPVLYKAHAADIYALMIDNYNYSGTLLSSDYVKITQGINRIRYEIFIPYKDLFPYAYNSEENAIRFAISSVNAVSDYETGVVYGAWSFGKGLFGENADPAKYGVLYSGNPIKTDFFFENGILNLECGIYDGSPSVMLRVEDSAGNLCYIAQKRTKNNMLELSIPLDTTKKYTLYLQSGRGNKSSISIN